VFLSKLSGGTPERYIPVGKVREIDDWPSVNLMIRISEFEKVGGFDCKFWPGEDTKLCLNLKKLGKKMLYIPTMIVWHHRREGLFAHLKQVGAYGLHRGYFAKNYPETSFKLKYFIPSIFSFFVIFSLLIQVIFNEYWNIVLSIGWMIYGFAVLIAILQIMRFEGVFVALISFPYILLTHFWYGIKFIYGFVHSDTLVSKLR